MLRYGEELTCHTGAKHGAWHASALGKHPVPLLARPPPVPPPPPLWRVIPDAPSPAKQGSACLATSLSRLWLPAHSPKARLAVCARVR